MALLICAVVAPGFSVAQMVVRFGMPPDTPAFLQSMAREGLKMPAHGWACATIGATTIQSPTSQGIRRISVLLGALICNTYTQEDWTQKVSRLTDLRPVEMADLSHNRWQNGADVALRTLRTMPILARRLSPERRRSRRGSSS